MTRTKDRLSEIEFKQRLLEENLGLLEGWFKTLRDGEPPGCSSPHSTAAEQQLGLLGAATTVTSPGLLLSPLPTFFGGVSGVDDLRRIIEDLATKIGYEIKYKPITPGGWELVEKSPALLETALLETHKELTKPKKVKAR